MCFNHRHIQILFGGSLTSFLSLTIFSSPTRLSNSDEKRKRRKKIGVTGSGLTFQLSITFLHSNYYPG